MNGGLLAVISILYLVGLIGLAFYAEKNKTSGKDLINNPYIYSLSLAVYCTAWTFFGSVGRVINTGFEFLTVYIGPSLVMLLGLTVLKKIIRISQVNSITSIADFISARYGKYRSLGVWVTIVSVLAGIPYIGLQIKAISGSFTTLAGVPHETIFYKDAVFYMVLVLIVFSILFGTRKIQPNETHQGMVFAIAWESIFKIVAFMFVGIYVVFVINDGFSSVITNHYLGKNLEKAFVIESSSGYGNWFLHTLISALAFMFLPRQFQVAVVENQSEKNLKQAIWLFPLYLFLINIFVIFIAISGASMLGQNSGISPDNYVLAIPLVSGHNNIALLAYLGGFSAATGMIIVETIAISTMVTNSVILPFLLESKRFKEKFTFKILNLAIWARRLTMIVVVLCAYIYFLLIGKYFSLVSIGLIAFVAIAQFAPILLGGIFWKGATKLGALSGLVIGVVIWFFSLVLPPLIQNQDGQFLILGNFYDFFSHFYIEDFDNISNSGFWCLLLNTLVFVTVSVFTEQDSTEAKQAELFVDIFKYSSTENRSGFWKGKARNENLFELLASFTGRTQAKILIDEFASKYEINLNSNAADPKLVSYIENTLAGIVGISTSNMLVSTIAKEEVVSVDEVLNVLKRSQKIIDDNEELKQKTQELERLSNQLSEANQKLKLADDQKNEFLTTVTHEIRTPLTSIKALTEIIIDNEDLDKNQKEQFLDTIIHETDRLSRLVNQVLDLEKYESGKHILKREIIDVKALIKKALIRVEELANEKQINLILNIDQDTKDIKGDEDKLIQMLINIISNAIKFVNESEGVVNIKLSSTKRRTIFVISDNGIGIPKDAQDRLFEKFYQVNPDPSSKNKGSGLGLSIVKKIVDLHKGSINIESTPQKGTKVYISIPTI